MSEDLALLIALAAPAVVLTVLRINAAMVFLSLCLGAVLVQYVATEAVDMLKLFAPKSGNITVAMMQLVLLLAPAAVTAVVTLFSVKGRVRSLLNILPAVASSGLVVLLAVPLLAPGLRLSVQSQRTWTYVSKSEALVVGIGALISMVFLWAQRRNAKHGKRSKE
jgi:hypothetical protein